MTFGELTADHLGRQIKVYGGRKVTIGRIRHELYHDKARTTVYDGRGIRYWIYTSDRECVLS
jgi:hypothetical protein